MNVKQKENIVSFLCGLLPALLLQNDKSWIKYSFKTLDISILPLPERLHKKLFDLGVFKIYDLFLYLPYGIDKDLDELKECVLTAYQKLEQYLKEK